MAIRSFRITSQKGFRLADAKDLSNFVVITGPNGAGKSTLLYELFRRHSEFAEHGTRVSYTGPHRPWRKSTLAIGNLFELNTSSFREILANQALPTWRRYVPEGLHHLGGQPRSHDTSDESFSLLKLAIGRIAMRRLNLMQRIFEREGESIPKGTMPDVYAPLKRAVRSLLPHLDFMGVELDDPNQLRCLFRRVDGDGALIDIDDLSSGEKAVIGLLFPFLEGEMEDILDMSRGVSNIQVTSNPVPTALIDEPELHLHPGLQVALVEYLRELAASGQAQFIIATHSPTVVDAARQEELYVLAPLRISGSDNQLIRVATSQEKLETIRMLTGSLYLVTRCRPIVYLEGAEDTGDRVSDEELVRILMPRTANWVLVPSGGRNQVVSAASRLREALADMLPGIQVFALVDSDQGCSDDPDWVISWPVAMIENLLLDADALWELLEPHRVAVGLHSLVDVRSALDVIAKNRVQEETRLRLLGKVRPFNFRLSLHDVNNVAGDVVDARDKLEEWARVAQETIDGGLQEVQELVRRIAESGRALESFHGKAILKAFYDQYAKKAGLSYRAFVYELARRVRDKERLKRLTRVALSRIENYVPKTLLDVLKEVTSKQKSRTIYYQ